MGFTLVGSGVIQIPLAGVFLVNLIGLFSGVVRSQPPHVLVEPLGRYSHTSILVSFRTHQNLYSSYFEKEKKMFQLSVLAQNLSHLLEIV